MPTSYPDRRKDLWKSISELRESAPAVMEVFSGLGKQAYAKGCLDSKFKELIALSIAVSGRCDGCIAFHAEGALRKGASREEVVETLGVAIQMGGGPAMVYAAEALRAYDEFSQS